MQKLLGLTSANEQCEGIFPCQKCSHFPLYDGLGCIRANPIEFSSFGGMCICLLLARYELVQASGKLTFLNHKQFWQSCTGSSSLSIST